MRKIRIFYRKIVPVNIRNIVRKKLPIIIDGLDVLWCKIFSVMHIHSADLMIPNSPSFKGGASKMQLVVVTRLMDVESYRSGEKNYYMIDREKLSEDELKEFYNMFYKFIDDLDTNGFNPQVSAIPINTRPIISLNEGTHRMGWILDRNPNDMVPVRVVPPYQNYYSSAMQLFKEHPVSRDVSNRIYKRYKELFDVLRRDIVGVIQYDIWKNNEAEIKEQLYDYGEYETETVDRIFHPNMFCKKTGIRINRNKKQQIFHIKLSWNRIRLFKGKLQSERVNTLNKCIQEKYGKNTCYFAGSVTESIILEDYIFSSAANPKLHH